MKNMYECDIIEKRGKTQVEILSYYLSAASASVLAYDMTTLNDPHDKNIFQSCFDIYTTKSKKFW